MFTKIPQKSQKNTYARVLLLIKLQAVAGLRPGTLLKKRLWSEPAIKEKVFWKYAAKLQENTHPEVRFQ